MGQKVGSRSGQVVPLETTFLKAAAWLAREAAMRAVQVKDSSFREARDTPAMMGSRAAYTTGWSMSYQTDKQTFTNYNQGY